MYYVTINALRIILVRTLRRDIAQYNKEDEEIDETLEETGWKLVHGDIFRPPTKSTILCALVGSGIQIGMMGLITIIVAMFGMLSPSARGSLITGESYFISHSVDNGFFSLVLFVYVYGNLFWLLWWSTLQDCPWSKLEERRLLDKFTLSGRCFWNMLLFEFLHLGSKVIWCSTFYDYDCHSMHVDGRQSPACLHRILFRIQETVEFS